jgi:hypothetical protein
LSIHAFSARVSGLILCCWALFFISTAGHADETRWRLVKIDSVGELMLVMTDTDEATDAFGFPYLQCKPGSGLMTVQENMHDDAVRRAIAGLIVDDGYPTVELVPGPERSVIDAIVSADDGGWSYHFQIGADAAAFNAFGRTGYLQFKIGRTAVKAGVNAGLDKITEFQAACRRSPKPTAFDRPKVQR